MEFMFSQKNLEEGRGLQSPSDPASSPHSGLWLPWQAAEGTDVLDTFLGSSKSIQEFGAQFLPVLLFPPPSLLLVFKNQDPMERPVFLSSWLWAGGKG